MTNELGKWWKSRFFIITVMIFAICVTVAGLIMTRRIKINGWFAERYSINGIDVSHHQGEIDWKKIEEQDVDFAFVKATEGSSHIDERFAENWEQVKDTSILAGAYHFFSFDSGAETQAQQFIDTVGVLDGHLSPVIDVEYYGDKRINPPEKGKLVSSLKEMLTILEEKYQVKPIIYTTYPMYFKYLKEDFGDYPLWIRNVYFKPGSELGQEWMFWQYSDTEVLEGYGEGGTETYIDRNVFAGDKEDLKRFIVGQEEETP